MKPGGLRASILDVAPVISPDLSAQRRQSRETAHALLTSISKPSASPNFEISQRVNYFPVKSGMEAALPMSCVIAWKGKGERPGEIVIVESIVDQDLNTPILELVLSWRPPNRTSPLRFPAILPWRSAAWSLEKTA